MTKHSIVNTVCSVILFCFSPWLLAQTEEPAPITLPNPNEVVFDTVKQRAQALVDEDYSPHTDELPKILSGLNYDQYRAIRFNPEHALWRNQALFEVQAFHPGFIFNTPVKINTVMREGTIQRLPFKAEDFIYDTAAQFVQSEQFSNVGFSGFRVHYPMNTGSYKDEVLAFQGASYFRLLSVKQTFGISARGVAINTAEPEGEEFPHFTEFWLLTPDPQAADMYIFALLDSPSLTGAFQFHLQPGLPSELKVSAHFYPRKEVKKVGLAALTSMFLFGENSVKHYDDFRPEVHDSDGLLVRTDADEWIWRALSNPPELRVVSLMANNVRGFGLMQRDSDFDHYQDIGATYHTRPSLWVEPTNSWGNGRVELVEIPSDSETNDNIVAYWVPSEPLKKGQVFTTEYLLKSVQPDFGSNDLAHVVRTGNSWATIPGSDEKLASSVRRFLVDFEGPEINALAADIPIEAHIQSTLGKVSDVTVMKIPAAQGWRVAFRLESDKKDVADMRLYLQLHGKRISEVWNYVWSAKSLD